MIPTVAALALCLAVTAGGSEGPSPTVGVPPALFCAGSGEATRTVPHFGTLREAMAFIVRCLDGNSPQSLLAACTRPDPMMNRVAFDSLKATHRKTPLDRLLAGREFPKDGTTLELGGQKELNGVHVDFRKTDGGWALESVRVHK